MGHAAYAFGYLEWQIVHIAEKLQPGYIQSVPADPATKKQGKTAGKIASDFCQIAAKANLPQPLATNLQVAAAAFQALVIKRNELVHAHPSTIRGAQRLNYWSPAKTYHWEPKDIDALILEIESLARTASALYYDPQMP